MKTKIIIDTDPGIDDAMAIFYALLDPAIVVLGLTTVFGNVSTAQATRNAIHLLDYFDSTITVAHGADAPLIRAPSTPSYHVHGAEGLGNLPAPSINKKAIKQSAAEFICDQINTAPNEITLCPIGPLSNIALALELDPSITQKVKSVVLMGGSFAAGGNITNWAEANIWNDPHAADLVFAADWPVSMIGLDVTQHVICTREDFQHLAEESPMLGGFLNHIAQFYIDFYEARAGIKGCHLHDPAAIIAAVHGEFFSLENHAIGVNVKGEKIGETICATDDRTASRVAMRVDSGALKRQFINTIKSGF